MTPEVEKKRRELFERSIERDWEEDQAMLTMHGDGYLSELVDKAWWGFNAALDAVEIKNPFAADPYDPDSAWASVKMNEAITATGLGLLIK